MATRTTVSDEVLLKFMDEIRADVKKLVGSISEVDGRVSSLRAEFDAHKDSEVKRAMLITIIMFLVGLIGGLLGYIWGKKDERREEVHQSIEARHSDRDWET